MKPNPYESLVEENPYAKLGEEVPPTRQMRTGVLTTQDDPGALGAAVIAAGRTTDKITAGTKRLWLQAKRRLAEARRDRAGVEVADRELAALAAEQASNEEYYQPLAEDRPVSTALGGAAPYAVPMGGIVSSGAIGGTMGTLEGGLEHGAVMGGLSAGGAAAGRVLGSVVEPGQRVMNRSILTAPTSELLDRARGFKNPDAPAEILSNIARHGYTPYVSEIGGSTAARQIEDYFARSLGGSGVMSKLAQGNARAVNTAAGQAIGERARNLSASVLDDAATRIGKPFEDVAALPGRPVALGPDVSAATTEVIRMNALRPLSQDPKLVSLARNLQVASQNNGRMTGEAYNVLRSDISAAARSADVAGTPAIGQMYRDILDALDSTAIGSLKNQGHGELAESLVKARAEYANLMTLERGKTVSAAGDVNPQALAQTIRQKYPRQYREGGLEGNPLYDIARYGETYPPLRPGSQTFERQAIQQLGETPAEMLTKPEGRSMTELLAAPLTAPVNWMGAKAMTSPLARYLSSRGVLGTPTFSHMGGVLSESVARDVAAGLPGSAGILSEGWR